MVVLALIPPRCECLADLRELTIQASRAKALIYLVGVHNAPVSAFTADLGLGATQGLEDSADSLPAPYRVAALTAVVVRPDGTEFRVVHNRGHGFQIESDVRALIPAMGPGPASGSPTASATSGSPAASAAPSASGAPPG